MARVIAVQEGQLKTLKDNYINFAVKTSNNAEMLSGALNNNVAPIAPEINMEDQPVNLSSSNTIEEKVIDNDVTNQVFGANNNGFGTSLSPVGSDSVPYQEPGITTNVSINTLTEEEYVKYINSLRNKLTTFYNDVNAEIDKLQEQLIQKSGASLVDVNKQIEPKYDSAEEKTFSGYTANNNNNVNIFDVQPQEVPQQPNLDETMVIPRTDFNNAIEEAQNGMYKAA